MATTVQQHSFVGSPIFKLGAEISTTYWKRKIQRLFSIGAVVSSIANAVSNVLKET